MATISVDYDSNGDVELILDEKNSTGHGQTGQQTPSSSEERRPAMYNVGPISIKTKGVRLRVSSLKLISTSRYFQAMFEGTAFRESKELKEHGFVEIELVDPEDEPTALMIILGILYGIDVQVPTELDLPMLCKVAVLVDKYQWHALVTPHAKSWFDMLVDLRGLPDAYDDSLLTWLWLTWLFGMKDHFKTLSRIAQQDCCHPINLDGESIRLSTRVLKAINQQREIAFEALELALKGFKERLLDRKSQEEDKTRGTKVRRYMALGYATCYSQYLELGEFAAPDHAGSSIRSLRKRIDWFQEIRGLEVRIPNDAWLYDVGDYEPWNPKKVLQRAINDLKIDEWGLDYDEFKSSAVANPPNRVSDIE